MLKLAPSVLSCSFANVKKAVDEVDSLGLEYLHLDVMDGCFVPEITFGAKLVKDIRRYTDITFDCHLMTVRPEDKIDAFIEAGADIITIHQEATVQLHRVLQRIKAAGIKCGISIVPSTPVSAIMPLLEMADLVLVMTVNPGYGGQKLIQSCLDKVVELKEIREAYGMTRAELERRIGVADRRLLRYENGETPQNNMDLIIAYRISKVLKCKMEDLLELEDEKK